MGDDHDGDGRKALSQVFSQFAHVFPCIARFRLASGCPFSLTVSSYHNHIVFSINIHGPRKKVFHGRVRLEKLANPMPVDIRAHLRDAFLPGVVPPPAPGPLFMLINGENG
jgi:hypothetical protein